MNEQAKTQFRRATSRALARLGVSQRWRPHVPRLFRAALLMLCGYSIFIFHGLSLHLTPWSQAFFNAIAKYGYPDTGQQQITVLLFREENLRALDATYPVPRARHVEVLEALAIYQPKAVFVDFAFVDNRASERKDTEDLAVALCSLQRAGTRVFLADARRTVGQTPIDRLFDCGITPVSAVIANDEGVSGVLTYAAAHAATGREVLPTAAFAMASFDAPNRGEGNRDLEIVWGNREHEQGGGWIKCHRPDRLDSVKQVLSQGPLALKKTCPYTRTISVAELLLSSGDERVTNALRGQYILYGADFDLSGDRVGSPVYGDLPGVYLHAMAFDNLLTFGADYKRAKHAGALGAVVDLFLLAAASLLLVYFPRKPREPSKSVREFVRRVWTGAVGLVALAGALAGAFHYNGLEPTILLAVVAYFAYRLFVNRDRGLVLFVLLAAIVGGFAYAVLNLGPRNIVAYLAFFEVVRHVQRHLDEVGHNWAALRAEQLHRAAPTAHATSLPSKRAPNRRRPRWAISLLDLLLLHRDQ